jgi:hypothetical protein
LPPPLSFSLSQSRTNHNSSQLFNRINYSAALFSIVHKVDMVPPKYSGTGGMSNDTKQHVLIIETGGGVTPTITANAWK